MRVPAEQIETIQRNVDIQAVPADHESLPQLEETFGAHTFFLSENGLLILEKEDCDCEDRPMARIHVVAVWEDEGSSRLLAQSPPVASDIVINLQTGDLSERP